MYADTLTKAYELERALQEQEQRRAMEAVSDEMSRERPHDEMMVDRFRQRMNSAACTPYEREFIAAWLELRDERKRRKYARLLDDHNLILHALHNDTPKGRAVDAETVSLDRLTVKT